VLHTNSRHSLWLENCATRIEKLIELKNTNISELSTLFEMGKREHIQSFLSTKSMSDHQREFSDDNFIYLNILNVSKLILGYIILLKNLNKGTIQLKRILVHRDNVGIGQDALGKLENYCISQLEIKRIWLDVYEDNSRAIHIYKKHGYQLFKTTITDNRKVLYYDKSL